MTPFNVKEVISSLSDSDANNLYYMLLMLNKQHDSFVLLDSEKELLKRLMGDNNE